MAAGLAIVTVWTALLAGWRLVDPAIGWQRDLAGAMVWPSLILGGFALMLLFIIGGERPTPGPNRFGDVPPWTPPERLRPPVLDEDAVRVRRRMKRLQRTTLLMEAASGPAFSKLGGLPDLAAEVPWPTRRTGAPLSFLAQLDLGQVRAAGGPEWLPETGFLYAFAAVDDGGDDPDLWRVIYQAEEPVDDFHGQAQGRLCRERRVRFCAATSLPSLDWLAVPTGTVDDPDALDELADLPERPFGKPPHHRIGGYPGEIQGDVMAVTCDLRTKGESRSCYEVYGEGEALAKAQVVAARSWRMLLQIDADDRLGMTWGDAGRLYFFVREKDARAADFSKVWMIWQCY